MAPSSEEIYQTVSEILDETLVPDDPVTPEATLLGDLGAESIDFLDIMHQLEKSFELSLNREDFYPDDILTDEQYVQDGRVTEAGIEALKARMPYADLSSFESDPSLKNFGDLLTVQDLCKMVEYKLSASSGAE